MGNTLYIILCKIHLYNQFCIFTLWFKSTSCLLQRIIFKPSRFKPLLIHNFPYSTKLRLWCDHLACSLRVAQSLSDISDWYFCEKVINTVNNNLKSKKTNTFSREIIFENFYLLINLAFGISLHLKRWIKVKNFCKLWN